MVKSWQQWLSPRPPNRTKNTSQPSFSHLGNAALYEPLSTPDGNWYVRETHNIENPLVLAGLSGPPLHIHLLQDETFKVEQGVLGVIKDGVEYTLTKDDGNFFVPRGSRHRFWCHESSAQDLVFTFRLDPATDASGHLLDTNFMRNLSGYLDDCLKSGMKPSLLQVILFGEDASTLLCPPFLNWMPVWLMVPVHRGLGLFAKSVLGYERSYPEYTRDA